MLFLLKICLNFAPSKHNFQDLRVFDEAACVYILLWKNNQYYKYNI